jgi:hypothetical protein
VTCSDVTIEAVADRLRDAPRGLIVIRDELAALLGSFNQYKSRGGGDVGNWLETHGGRAMLIDRKTGDTRTVYIPRASVSICGGIQPGTLQRALTSEFYENGFCARLLFAYPPRRPKRWSEEEVDSAQEQQVREVFDRLFALQPSRDSNGEPEPIDVPLSSAAKARWIAFVNESGRDQFGRDKENLVAAFSKLEGYAARFALIFHQVRHAAGDATVDAFRIDDSSVADGIKLAQWFGDEAERVYAVLAESDEERARRTRREFIRGKGGTITPRELQQTSRRYRNEGAAVAALQELVDAGEGEWLPPNSTGRAGRPPGLCFSLAPERRANEMPHGGSASRDYVGAGALMKGGSAIVPDKELTLSSNRLLRA